MGALGALIGLLMGPATFGFLGGVLFTAGLAAGGFALPGILVNGRAKRRREEIRSQLPDALDLLAVSVEAGMGFDGAISKLTEYMDGPLGEEFALTLGEMRIGESRSDALKKLGERAEHARGRGLHARDHPGRPARHLAGPHPAGAGHRHA